MGNPDNRLFQWIAGDKRGQILVFDKIEEDNGEIYIVFKDKSRINENFVAEINQTDLTNKFMAEVDSYKNCWQFKEEYVGREEEKWEKNADGENVCVQPFIPGKKIVKLIPPRRTSARSSSFGNISNLAKNDSIYNTPITPAVEESKIDKNDPVYILISKSKKNDLEINMGMIISLPSKDLYNIAKESFENGSEKFVQFIVDEITIDEIKKSIKEAIFYMYEQGNESIQQEDSNSVNI